MATPNLTREGKEVLDEIANTRPSIIKEKRRQAYLRMLSFLMNEKGVKQADWKLVTEAIIMIESKSLDPTFFKREDPDKFKRFLVDPRTSVEACYAIPIEIKR